MATCETHGHLRGAGDKCIMCKHPMEPPHMSGAELILLERQRQIEAEGWTPEHDDEHDAGQLAAAARCYTKTAQLQVCRLVSRQPGRPEFTWPWDDEAWKPSPDAIRNLVKAGALIAAEIDRITRSREPKGDCPT